MVDGDENERSEVVNMSLAEWAGMLWDTQERFSWNSSLKERDTYSRD